MAPGCVVWSTDKRLPIWSQSGFFNFVCVCVLLLTCIVFLQVVSKQNSLDFCTAPSLILSTNRNSFTDTAFSTKNWCSGISGLWVPHHLLLSFDTCIFILEIPVAHNIVVTTPFYDSPSNNVDQQSLQRHPSISTLLLPSDIHFKVDKSAGMIRNRTN